MLGLHVRDSFRMSAKVAMWLWLDEVLRLSQGLHLALDSTIL